MSFDFIPFKIRSFSDKYSIIEKLWLFIFAYLLLPGSLVHTPGFGLDGSWRTALDLASIHDLRFGTDFNFTYGPLGFLFTKEIVSHSHWWILLFELSVLALSIFLLRKGLISTGSDWKINILIALALFMLRPGELSFLLAPLFVILVILFFDERKPIYLYLAIVIAVLNLFIKVNYGIVLILLLAIIFISGVFFRLITFTYLAKLILVLSFLLVVSSFLLNVDFIKYLMAGVQLIDAYNDAMYFGMSIFNWKLVIAIEVLIAMAVGYIFYARDIFRKPLFFIGFLLSAAYAYLLFKNGYVRAEDHYIQFFRLGILPMGILYVYVLKGKSVYWSYATSISIFLLINVLCILELSREVLIPIRNLAFKYQYFIQAFSLDEAKLKHAKGNVSLNKAFLSQIQGKSVDILPTEISLVHRHGLNYCPRPLIQSYSAYNTYLDSMNYKKYTSTTAPEFLVFQNVSIDGRLAFWDESITKRAILTNYKLVLTDTSFSNEFEKDDANSGAKLLLLQKSTKPLVEKIVREEKVRIVLGEALQIKKSDHLQFLYVEITYNVKGKIQRFLFQPPALTVKIIYEDSTSSECKAVVPILKTGVLINKKIRNTDDAMLFFKYLGEKNKNIVSVTFNGENGFNSEIKATILYLEFK